MSDSEEEQFKLYKGDSRIPCRYGAKCYQKNAAHHEKYKHLPSKDAKKQKGGRRVVIGKKRKKHEDNEGSVDSSKKKVLKKDDAEVNESVPQIDNDQNVEKTEENFEPMKQESDLDNENPIKHPSTQVTIASLLRDCNFSINDNKVLPTEVQTIISHLFLTEMPEDFFQLYEFCKTISEKDPLNVFKDVQLQLVGPYDIFNETFLNSKVDDKKSLLRHWRYYYDPPEFQTIIKVNGKEALHFGYWRDNVSEGPEFVAKNTAIINCVIEPVAENIFATLYVHLEEKIKMANPFEKTHITQLQQKLKNYAREKNITLNQKSSRMQDREKKVVARTFHKAGIVVPYDKKTELGYRNLAVTDNELKKILKQIGDARTPEERKIPFSKLEEVIRLATIAADECDFGTCLELGHDLFCSGIPHVQNKALNMLSLAYNLLQRPQFLEIVQAHFKDRNKGQNLSILH
ncbi:histone PARylation factor 1 isoform X1 [Megalopta genalis]|uniref:histone PARylation factor 1 isoform X1 n=1 Tax=Megalopta genalis TaxID=115081 RepID=UPI003FCF47E3